MSALPPKLRVSTLIAQAFGKWTFHPAQVNNQPVAVKLLIGIPLQKPVSATNLADGCFPNAILEVLSFEALGTHHSAD